MNILLQKITINNSENQIQTFRDKYPDDQFHDEDKQQHDDLHDEDYEEMYGVCEQENLDLLNNNAEELMDSEHEYYHEMENDFELTSSQKVLLQKIESID